MSNPEPTPPASENRLPVRDLLKLLAFFLPLCVGTLLVQQCLLYGLRHYRTAQLGVWNKVIAGQVNADVLVVGSSRAFVNADPDILAATTHKSAFNIGRNGTAIDLQRAFFKMYLRHNRAPQYIILCVDITTFNMGGVPANEHIAYLNQPEIAVALSHRDRIWKLYRYLPFIGLARLNGMCVPAIRGLLDRPGPEYLRNGFWSVNRKWGPEFETFKKNHPDGITYPIGAGHKEHLRQILETCRQRQIRAILVFPPEYIESQSLTLNRSAVISVYQEFSRQFNIPFWDYSTDPLCEKKEYFYNSQHLNSTGATLFSRDCATRLEALMKSSAP